LASSFNQIFRGAAGTSGDSLNVEDVFSTFLYDGQNSQKTITNNIDLSTEGGLVWCKDRKFANYHRLYDTVRGVNKYLQTYTTAAQGTNSASGSNHGIDQFNSDGFRIGGQDGMINDASSSYVSWTFRKAPKFFDIVTYTGNGVAGRTIAHSLGTTVGMLIIKELGNANDWDILHKDSEVLRLNSTAAPLSGYAPSRFGNGSSLVRPTSSVFTVGSSGEVNGSNKTYVAYLFAHNDGDGGYGSDGDQDIIKCGTYDGNNSGINVNVGFPVQWLLVKNISTSSNWAIFDIQRGMEHDENAVALNPNVNTAEASTDNIEMYETATGFASDDASNFANINGSTYIYVAIRFPNMKDVTAGTEVFGNITYTGNATDERVITNDQTNRVDSVVILDNDRTVARWFDRTQGIQFLTIKDDSAGITSNTRLKAWGSQHGVILGNGNQTNGNNENYTAFFWTRRKGCYDIVRYKGTSSGRNITHNLGVVPEMMIARGHVSGQPWIVYHKDMDANNPQNYYAFLDTDAARVDDNGWNDTAPTASVFSVEGNESNKNNIEFTCWLYATLAGVTKVGTYTGNGGSLTVDCGFASTARYVMVKRILASGSWLVFSSAMGIVAGNEPAHYFDVGGDSGSGTDHIDPESSGFIVNSVGSDSKNPNHNGSKYIFYAVA